MPRTKDDRKQGKTTLWLLDIIEQYLEFNDMDNDGYRFGRLVGGDRTLVTRLRDGGDISITRMDEILEFMQQSHVYNTAVREGPVTTKTLKPFTIEPRSIP